MSDLAVVARSPITPAPPLVVRDGWEVSARQTTAALTLTDETPLTKVQLKAHWSSTAARALGVPFGRATRRDDGTLAMGSGPGEWLMFGPPGHARELMAQVEALCAADSGGTLATVVDLTHGRALMRLTGVRAADVLARVCAVDCSEAATPHGTAFRSSVAKLVTDLVRDDRSATPSYLLHCERSSGQYLFDALLDAGAEFGIDVAGLAAELPG